MMALKRKNDEVKKGKKKKKSWKCMQVYDSCGLIIWACWFGWLR